ncbi:hypothetical protein KJR33_09040 [Pediococcus pentosaceus]|nr:hypothetical protein [Pediococcus pentosaceus]
MSSITYPERIKIETFRELGLSNIQMGVRLKRSRCGRKTKLSDELKQKILNHLRLSWSPGMIAHEFKLATKSIYNWLNQGRISFSLNELPERGSNERFNRNLRYFYPKGTRFEHISAQDLTTTLLQINQ